MGAYIVTRHPRPLDTHLLNHKQVREEIILSFNTAQQQFLRNHKWKFRRDKAWGWTVRISFPYYFAGPEDTYFRLLFNGYKLFNYCKKSLDFSIKSA